MTQRDWATAIVLVLMVAVGAGLFGIPYNWCNACYALYPDWLCWPCG